MAFPFAFVPGLRERLIFAISTSSLVSIAALGCTTQSVSSVPTDAGAKAHAQIDRTARDSGGPKAVSDAGPSASAGRDGDSGRPDGKDASRGGASGALAQAGMSSAGASGARAQAGASSAGVAGTKVSGAAGVSQAGEPAMCPGNAMEEPQCFTRERLEGQAQFGCGNRPPGAPTEPRFTPAELATHFLANGCLEHQLTCDGCCNPAVAPGIAQDDGTCCYVFCPGSCCGRPLVIDGQARLASVESRSDWLQPVAGRHADTRIAREWLEDARMEHASIASFARFTLDLLAFGAPAELVTLAQRAGLEEVEHARLCFGLAAHYGASELGPGPLAAADVRVAPSLWHAAIAAFEEGCIGETLAALHAQAALEHATHPEARAALSQIAKDEAAHAELAWRFVSWSAARFGDHLTRALEQRLAQHTASSGPDQEPGEVIAALHAAGRLTQADKDQITRAGLQDVIAPCLAAIIRAPGMRDTDQTLRA